MTDNKSENIQDKSISKAELVYDDFYTYSNFSAVIRFMGDQMILIPELKDEGGNPYGGKKLVQYLFKEYFKHEITVEQAHDFMPYFILEMFSKMPEIDHGDEKTREERVAETTTRIKEICASEDFKNDIEQMFELYSSIKPFLHKELDKLHDLHPETRNNAVQYDDLKALVFSYMDLSDDELEPLFEKCRTQAIKEEYKGGTISYHKYFEYIYAAVKAARQAVLKELEPIKEEPLRQNLIPKVNPYLPDCFFIMKDIVTKKLMFDRDYKYDKKTRLPAANEDKVANGIYKTMPYITILVSWKDNKSIMQPITGFDRELYFRVCNLYYEGQDYLTFNQIARAMGYKSNVGKVYREKIINSLLKLATTWVLIDNTEETKVFKDYEPVRKYAPYLTFSFDECYVKGQLTHGIRIHDDPHLFLFGYERGHFATVPIEALQCEISMNDTLADIRYYLLSHISWLNNLAAKHQPYHKTLKLDTIWENCHITTRRQQNTQKEKLKYILEPMKTSHFIKDYEIDDECITITANKEYANEESLAPKRKNK